jgi:hypothetical protein
VDSLNTFYFVDVQLTKTELVSFEAKYDGSPITFLSSFKVNVLALEAHFPSSELLVSVNDKLESAGASFTQDKGQKL